MAHKFDRSKHDPYVAAAHQIERNVFASRAGLEAGAGEEIYSALGDAIVTAPGDIAAQAYRYGVNQPEELDGLARAIAGTSKTVIMSYQGEVAPDAAIEAIASDPRVDTLTDVDRDELTREIEKTAQLEQLLLSARRLPELLDFAGSLGLQNHEDAVDNGTLLVSAPHTPTPQRPPSS